MIDFEPTEEQALLRETVAELGRTTLRPRMREFEHARGLAPDVRAALFSMGLHLAGLPEALGGQGLGLLGEAIIEEELASADPAAAYAAPGSGAFGRALLALGTEAQQRRWLEGFEADAPGGHLLSGAVAWSEAAPNRERPGFLTTARREGDHWVLRGIKSFVLNAGEADRVVVFAQTEPDRGWDGLGAFVLRPGEGTRRGERHRTLGLDAASFGELHFDGARVADEDRLGGDEPIFARTLGFFVREALRVAARAVGLGQAAFDQARDFADTRRAFGKPIGHFQAVAFKLADRLIDVESARWLVWRAAWSWDAGRPQAECLQRSAQAAAHALEAAMRAADDAVQLHGGAGFMRDYPVEKMMRDAKQMALTCMTAELLDQLSAAVSLGLPHDPALLLPTPELQAIFT